MRGEWIEMYFDTQLYRSKFCLSPCGESGLKYFAKIDRSSIAMSLPMRGEWIEIKMMESI